MCGLMFLSNSSFCKAPRKKSSSDIPASRPTMSIERMSAMGEVETKNVSIALLALFSRALSFVSRPARFSGKCMPSFHATMQLRSGSAASSVMTAMRSGLIPGADSMSRKRAGSLVMNMAVTTAGVIKMSRS